MKLLAILGQIDTWLLIHNNIVYTLTQICIAQYAFQYFLIALEKIFNICYSKNMSISIILRILGYKKLIYTTLKLIQIYTQTLDYLVHQFIISFVG